MLKHRRIRESSKISFYDFLASKFENCYVDEDDDRYIQFFDAKTDERLWTVGPIDDYLSDDTLKKLTAKDIAKVTTMNKLPDGIIYSKKRSDEVIDDLNRRIDNFANYLERLIYIYFHNWY